MDNSHLQTKLELRRRFLDEFGGSRVLETCAGDGVIWDILKEEYPELKIARFDKQSGKVGLKITDSSRVLDSVIKGYDVIDIDPYGSPWKWWLKLARNYTQDCTVFLTAGRMGATGGGMERLGREESALMRLPEGGPPSLKAQLKPMIERAALGAILARFNVIKAVKVEPALNIKYFGLRLEKYN